MAAPPSYADLGKAAKDIFNKGYGETHTQSLSVLMHFQYKLSAISSSVMVCVCVCVRVWAGEARSEDQVSQWCGMYLC